MAIRLRRGTDTEEPNQRIYSQNINLEISSNIQLASKAFQGQNPIPVGIMEYHGGAQKSFLVPYSLDKLCQLATIILLIGLRIPRCNERDTILSESNRFGSESATVIDVPSSCEIATEDLMRWRRGRLLFIGSILHLSC